VIRKFLRALRVISRAAGKKPACIHFMDECNWRQFAVILPMARREDRERDCPSVAGFRIADHWGEWRHIYKKVWRDLKGNLKEIGIMILRVFD
jgi:hypothetical protein